MSEMFNDDYQTPRTRGYVLTIFDNTQYVAINVFDFCVRNYKRHCQPVIYPIYKSTIDYVATCINQKHRKIKNKYF